MAQLPNNHIANEFLKHVVVMPNPALKGGELQVTAMEGAKQSVYAEHRRKMREGWQESLLACGCPKCLAIMRDPAKEKGL